MVDLMLERANHIEGPPGAWDVLVKQAIPAGWIESVLPKDDATLAG